MKKVFLTLLMGVSLATTAFAKDEFKVNNRIKNSFNIDFGVKEVEWRTNTKYATAAFLLDSKKVEAYYDLDGSLIGTSQAVTVDFLPSSAKRTIAKKYSDYTITEAIKFSKPDETSYFISAVNQKEKVILQVSGGQVSVFRKG